MPKNKDALSRYRWIDERLRNKMLPHPKLQDLLNFVSKKMGREVPLRTLQKDIQDMRYDEELNYKAPIEYVVSTKMYRYSEENYSINNMPVSEADLQGLEIAIGVLQQFRDLPMIRQFEDAILKIAAALKINRETLEDKGMIHLDQPVRYKGLEWVQDIAEAIHQRKVIRIAYQSFGRSESKDHWLEPYHLREYRNLFYVIGKSRRSGSKGKILTFGLDRILDIWQTNESFDEKNFDEGSYFKDTIGITVSEDEPQKIILSFTPLQGKYIKSQPIHPSQKILKDNEKECRVELNLTINHELLMLLLSYGAGVKIVKPAMLVNRMKEELSAMEQLY